MSDEELKAILTDIRQSIDSSAKETREYVDASVSASAAETREYVDASVSASAAETRHHVDARVADLNHKLGLTAEHLRGEIRLVAESVMALDEKCERRFTDLEGRMERGFQETHALIKFGYADLDRRVRVLENRS